jgi:hypothetical protein
MSDIQLSILIPTVNDRKSDLERLVGRLLWQCQLNWPGEYFGFVSGDRSPSFHGVKGKFIEIIYCPDDREMTIGEKRELLYKRANGLYSWQIDDDDDISDNALNMIAKAMAEGPDCITYLEHCTINGKQYLSNHSLQYQDWADNQDGYDFVRTPYMKDVIKTGIARKVLIDHVRYGEDHIWSRALKPFLKTEVHIDQVIYLYQHTSKPEDHGRRYGIQ